MFRLSKVSVRGIPIGLTLVALALAGGITNVQASAILNTFEQSQPVAAPETASLVLLGIALIGFGAFGLRRKS